MVMCRIKGNAVFLFSFSYSSQSGIEFILILSAYSAETNNKHEYCMKLINRVEKPAIVRQINDSACTGISDMPAHGVPTVRLDLPAPRIRRVSDRTNYGDQATAYDLLYPPLHSLWGVNEEHFFSARSKDEVRTQEFLSF